MAPEARGASLMSVASAPLCALGVVCSTMSPPHALASGAELQRWTGGPQPPFTQPSTNGADVAKVDLPVCRLIETTPVDYPVLLDRERAVARAWKVATLPNTFVLDADLRPRLVVEAEFAWGLIDLGKLQNMITLAPAAHALAEF
jgi:hypothetical protein